MQDSSRGNPFPQNAVQEFRVVTQNYKAEYEKSSSAIITAVTKSGGNELHGDGFADFQDKGCSSRPDCAEERCERNPDLRAATSTALSLGGPIMQDKLHFFGSCE